MMGSRHLRSGVLLAVAAYPVPVLATGQWPDPVLWGAGCVAGALLPDFDLSVSHAARTWGPFTRVAAAVVGRLAGGHRESTHDIVLAPLAVGGVLAALVAGASALAAVGQWAWLVGLVLLALPFGIALRLGSRELRVLRRFRSGPVNFAGSVGAAWWLLHVSEWWWFPVAVAAGVVVHVLGDSVTNEGAPVSAVWVLGERLVGRRVARPWRQREWGLRCCRVGSPAEAAMGPVMVSAAWAIGVAYCVLAFRAGVIDIPALSGPAVSAPSVPGLPEFATGDVVDDVGRVLERALGAVEDAARGAGG